VTPLYPQKLALTSPTGGGHSVGMVRSRTRATEFSLAINDDWERLKNEFGVHDNIETIIKAQEMGGSVNRFDFNI
jgi:hypothetical protein